MPGFAGEKGIGFMPNATRTESARRVFVTGVFDMRNFGDLLFPLIASFRLAPAGIDVIPVAPTKAPPCLADGMATQGIAAMIEGEEAVDAILVGGGYIVHTHGMELLENYRANDVADWAGPGLWLGATLAAGLRDVPIAWNAPGVPHPLPRSFARISASALRAADYVSVRDRGSLDLLEAPEDVAVHVVPDTIADLARLWPPARLAEDFRALVQRKGMDPGTRYFSVHLRNRSLAGEDLETVARRLDELARARQLIPLLVAVGQSHDDDAVARAVALHLRGRRLLLDDPLSLREVAAAIAFSSLYVGASLHGYIAAAAYGVPGVLVAKPAYRKFKGFLDHAGRLADLTHDWDEALATGAAHLDAGHGPRLPESVFAALDEHWARIRAAIADPAAKRDARRRFVQAYVRQGIEREGPRWAHLPLVNRAARTDR